MDYLALIPDSFSGAVSITQGGETLFRQAFGMADIANSRPNTMDTRFGTASAGKAFVACGVMHLVEAGKLRLASTLGELLDLAWHSIDPGITVRQLLNHTSGVPDYFDEDVMDDYADLFRDLPNYRIRSAKDLLPLFIDKPMMYPADEKFQYNNSGYVLLGLILEQVAGLPLDRYLQQTVFDPCGMTRTGYYELDRLPEGCANGYILDEGGGYHTNIYSIDAKGSGAGGAFTTIPDVQRFWDGLLSCRLLSTASVQEMTSPQVRDACYGYGFWLSTNPDTPRFVYFQGSDPGVSFISSYQPSDESFVTLVSNREDDVWQLHRELRARLAQL